MITWVLVLINVAVYVTLAYFSQNPFEIERTYLLEFGFSKEMFFAGNYWQLLTSMFVHFDLPHLGYNMIFLLLFGLKSEEIYGKKFQPIYLASGLFASLAAFGYPSGVVSGGASGAIFGALGANLIAKRNLYPSGMWTSILYGFVFFILAKTSGFPAHLAGLIFGFISGYWITKDWYPSEEEKEKLDEGAVEALEDDMLKAP